MNPLQAVDDFLIDRVFQPFCDAVQTWIGYTKHAIRSVLYGIIAVSWLWVSWIIASKGRGGWFFLLMGVFIAALDISSLLNEWEKEKNAKNGEGAFLSPARALGFPLRTTGLAMLFFFWALFFPDGVEPFEIGLYAAVSLHQATLYVDACTIRPPGKSRLKKLAERIRAWRTPLPQPASS